LNADSAWDDVRRELAPLYHLLPLVLPGMYARRWGRVIGLAQHPQKLSPAYAYNVGKAARMQALLLAYEQAWRQGVTVNVVAPGPVAPIESLEQAIDLCNHGAAWQQRANVTPRTLPRASPSFVSKQADLSPAACCRICFTGKAE
jgi:NAD(P)-dependent dehydrogenase (short-subunit alcohol dehydrogenase family)